MKLSVHMICRLYTFVSLSIFCSIVPSLALAVEVNCESPWVYCLEEFEALADQSDSIEALVPALPSHVKRNVTFKRGNNISKITVGELGPHGHLTPTRNSGSATPEQPRVIVWDQLSGFTASWNSGNTNHSAHNRVDIYDFDFDNNEHRLVGWSAERGWIAPHEVDGGRTCVQCHGESQRPIFPMYPDWPQFYGEFNDEMNGYENGDQALRSDLRVMGNQFQSIERALYSNFLANEAQNNPRYKALFDVKAANNSDNPYYPYRPRNVGINNSRHTSRA
ncbi:MAG: hypothetical protein HRT44_00700, partial [Bdellovibrionales bacterium]|nr:hypothetical protein [Bdellovibrionales bacterium]NQZ17770.1 hypothetical protein [Bdellovibrionales bacterium]